MAGQAAIPDRGSEVGWVLRDLVEWAEGIESGLTCFEWSLGDLWVGFLSSDYGADPLPVGCFPNSNNNRLRFFESCCP